ncbi:GINS complex subunit Psf3, putative [Plasmodium knowlesi strain H]|uniref:GINS complex subunit Psf3, putative n=3 Tax=Plasmodium knowlesi TaxID=5850 RepID=A0A5K1UR37_PLAKH|nr:GINS complex subunit Psf3, putative [Plasmodium knowlesi strain H]OTN67288.1 putative GINS complex subunit Psf3 [Plasmodium knowlesi]CAA9987419.1 GINS complex subunit Psf3, putative [Plasmodium knowlesi strain H]SBO23278.1 GINS complex subunit Psf3, putative [Plasmodium knowlesi strain H]SBO24271.1 GINS complex subunit Psf3, putative [Plasmodium knowlesi strain H]VVS76893.1 GINS complex subunit Psf3, putative [Plasmodium knowlesi strain H]|eukprot:XP_002258420.1 GINS complex subunit Psf3, putative [Plasmodium knowlesi strain H]
MNEEIEKNIKLNSNFIEFEEIVKDINTPFSFIDLVEVPCVPLVDIYGLSLLSNEAYLEYKNGLREDKLSADDEIRLTLFFAVKLYKRNVLKIKFPSYYDIIETLKFDPVSVTIGLFNQFYFETAYELCDLLPVSEWPSANFYDILRKAEKTRIHFLINNRTKLNSYFLEGLTNREKKIYKYFLEGTSKERESMNKETTFFNFYEMDK